MTNGKHALALKLAMAAAACLQLLILSATLMAQEVSPRGIPPPRRNTPDYPERDFERQASRRVGRVNVAAPDRRLTLIQIKKDFVQIQVLNNQLRQEISSNHALDYKQISDTAGKIKSLAGRLDSNLILGKAEVKEPRAAYEVSEGVLQASILSLHDLVISFVESPIFKESGVFDIQETQKAKQNVETIIALSDQVKRIAKKLSKEAGK